MGKGKSHLLAVNQEGWGSNDDEIEGFAISVAASTSRVDVSGLCVEFESSKDFGSGSCFPI